MRLNGGLPKKNDERDILVRYTDPFRTLATVPFPSMGADL